MNKKYLVYGTGKLASDFIKSTNLNIVGILDQYRLYGTFCDIQIYSLEDIEINNDIDGIILAVSNRFIREIYYRIVSYANARNIRIFTMGLQDLNAYFGVQSNIYKKDLTHNILMEKIDLAEVVSFDIFDTLLMRKIIHPVDVFKLVYQKAQQEKINVDKDFYKVRREAEILVAGEDIYTIYDKLQQIIYISNDEKQRLIELEIQCEKEVLVTREYVKEIFNHCVNLNKTVVITSDMYLPSKILQDILLINGISGYQKIYVSCEHKCTKANGLLAKLKEEFKNKKIIHIGDNFYADIEPCFSLNIESIQVTKAYEIAMTSPLNRAISQTKTLTDSLFLGNIINHFFNNPLNQIIEVKDLETFSEFFLLPTALAFFYSLQKIINKNDYEGIIFIARDGYFFHQCYEKLRKMSYLDGPASYYILGSRKLAIRSGMQMKSDIDDVIKKYNIDYSVAELNQFFSVESKSINGVFDDILQHSKDSLYGYKQYLSNQGLDFKKKYLYCELNGHGTGFYYFNRIFNQKLDSLYLIRKYGDNKFDSQNCINAYIHIKQDEYNSLFDNVLLMESVFTSPNASITDFNKNGQPKFATDFRNSMQIKMMQKIQKILLNQVVDHFFNYFDSLSPEVCSSLVECFLDVPLMGECSFFRRLSVPDDLFQNDK